MWVRGGRQAAAPSAVAVAAAVVVVAVAVVRLVVLFRVVVRVLSMFTGRRVRANVTISLRRSKVMRVIMAVSGVTDPII
jgi:hypothetical protein